MKLSAGIVGLPNIGKSTLFNALLKKQAALAANYPFATIEPNVGIVPVPDPRLGEVANVIKEESRLDSLPPLVPATVEFYDIAGLVKGASEGAGLGNKFLAHIREVSVVCHILRNFSDPDIIREGSSDAKADYETIKHELLLADLQTLEKAGGKSKLDSIAQSAVDKAIKAINDEIRVRDCALDEKEREALKPFCLLTDKPEIIVLNVAEEDYKPEKFESMASEIATALNLDVNSVAIISAKIESELAGLEESEQLEYLETLGLKTSGLERLIRKVYEYLNLISYFTAGPKEVRAWTINKGDNAQQAAGAIHGDFEKNFISAEVIKYDDFVADGGWLGAKDKGHARLEGKNYIVNDGDVMIFRHNS